MSIMTNEQFDYTSLLPGLRYVYILKVKTVKCISNTHTQARVENSEIIICT